MMDNYENDLDRKGLRDSFLELLSEEEKQRNLSNEEFEIVADMILEPLEKNDTSPFEFLGVLLVGVIMLEWLRLQFLPSQIPHNFELTATLFRMYPSSKLPEAPAPSGMSQFWDALISKGMSKPDDANKALDWCLDDTSLPQWARVTALELKVWHHARVQEYNEAYSYINMLRDSLYASKSKADYLMGYIKALEDNQLALLDNELNEDMFIMVPEAVPSEFPLIQTREVGVSLSDSTIEALTLAMEERLGTRFLLGVWEAKEEIIKNIPNVPSLETVNQRLKDEYGHWVDELANKGALTNAEFLYDALKAKSWGGVITEYSAAIEAEVTVKLLPWLGRIMSEKGTSLESILPSRVESGGSNLGYAEMLLRRIAASPVLKSYMPALPGDNESFLLYKLPNALVTLRNRRNVPAHGAIGIETDAKEMRIIVLGTYGTPGLLKRLHDVVNFPVCESQ